GKKGDLSILYTNNLISPKRILLVGLGKKEELELETIRKMVGSASRKARNLNVNLIGIDTYSFSRNMIDLEKASEALVQSIIMGTFQNLRYKTKDKEKFNQIDSIALVSSLEDKETIEKGAYSGKIIGDAVNFCRTLSWSPANYITPTKLAQEAIRLEKELGIKTKIIDREEAKEIGLTSFLAVAQGTEEPPKFIIMEYNSKSENTNTIALIGKAITFDSGGISIKPSQNMEKMKADMTGGAIVLAIMEVIARLKLGLHVVGFVPATDNMPSGKAYHPGDIITTYNGLTVEVISTDAEGRMILNDALAYAAKNYKPNAMFDFATLTGAMVVALGEHAIGYFTNDDKISQRLEEASKISGEKIWRMPLWEEYDEQLKSDVADLKHTGGRPAGAITAARFLSKFVQNTPWAHLDVAGVMEQTKDDGYNPKGSKGPAVRLIIEVLRNW
ncbi:MAG: leucyl aminopeptidase, partial [Candidatus Heimdallarchaeaceae archaeon]